MTHDHRASDPGIRIVTATIPLAELAEMAADRFGDLVKAVVDIERGVMALDAEMHADEESLLLDRGSRQEDLWDINLYPDRQGTRAFIEFDSMSTLIWGHGAVPIGLRTSTRAPRPDARGRSVARSAATRDRTGARGRV